jgi:hypothetical protein
MSYRRDGKPHGARPGQVLAQRTTRSGHRVVSIRVNGNKHQSLMPVHVLMLEAFVSPRPEGQVGRHLNDVPDDNRLENLAWGTHQDNSRDSVTNGGHRNTAKVACKRGHRFAIPNLVLRRGVRYCRACDRARAHFFPRRIGECEAEFQVYADASYVKVMEGSS